MDKILISDLGLLKVIAYGSFCEVCQCEINGKKYAFKKFYDPDKFIDKSFLKKIDALSKISLEKSVVPQFLVANHRMDLGYLTELLVGKDYILLEELSEKVNALKDAKSAILELHYNKIIHTDIHGCNIFVLKDGTSRLLDFDNISYKRKKPIEENYSDFALEFVSRYGLSKDLDIYLFNLLTFASLNNCKREDAPALISEGNYGVFTDVESKKICDSLMLEERHFNNEYLIDTVDLDNIEKIYQLKLY